ncbi:hypothetical protein ABZ419_11160 [Streptomyces cinnamoneus]|uniref:hypothetical protein n=1 Tax=Streptomyces cinnamoneus TaxID=53446 RepID=UPI0033E91013
MSAEADTNLGPSAYEVAQVRARQHAVERPLPYEAEALLWALAAGQVHDEEEAQRLLVWRYVARDGDGRLSLTDAGLAYLNARGEI